ncbi:phosphotransferase [Lentzea jiangxiensis]|uniref:Phosphotransferase enzyme family protein n=1 Tax=Lentzea jiangxiensis TaxID=641025 RepID=A0A1H0R300_9PSEU|nr:phosphotransferase [Lentzea jiangxiensis]SDP23368.1 Phosphotransferase enzyme family protein [Lentzea jiangxiensis]
MDALSAAVSLAASHDVVSSDPVVLKRGSNVLVHLRPAPVVARVAARTALIRPSVADHFARDLSISAFLAARGVPVVTPSGDLPAGPHTFEGFVMSFSTYVPHESGARLPREDVLKLLPDLHAELRHYEGVLPTRGPLDDVDNVLAYLACCGVPDLDRFRAWHDSLAARWTEHHRDVQPLHGDAHPGNLLLTPSGPVWNDFEDAWLGPVAWDMACSTTEEAAPRAVELYGGGAALADVEFHVKTRTMFGTLWGVLVQWS